MTAEQLSKVIMADIDNFVFPGNERGCEDIIKEHIEKVFRMAEATIRDSLSRARICDD